MVGSTTSLAPAWDSNWEPSVETSPQNVHRITKIFRRGFFPKIQLLRNQKNGREAVDVVLLLMLLSLRVLLTDDAAFVVEAVVSVDVDAAVARLKRRWRLQRSIARRNADETAKRSLLRKSPIEA